MLRERELCTLGSFNLGVCPACNLIFQIILSGIVQVLKPTDVIKVQVSGYRIIKANIFINQHVIHNETNIVTNKNILVLIDKDFCSTIFIL